MSIIIPTTGPVWKIGKAVVGAGNSQIVDQISVNTFRVAVYHVAIFNIAQSVTKHVTLTVKTDGTTSESSVSNKLGDSINFNLSESVVSGNMELTLQNNEGYDITIAFGRLNLGQN